MEFMHVQTTPHLLIYVVIYFLVMLGIGAWASKKVKSSEDYALAGRSLGPFVLMGTRWQLLWEAEPSPAAETLWHIIMDTGQEFSG